VPYFAHTREDHDGRRLAQSHWQPLRAHLASVARIAADFGRPLRIEAETELAGWLHDLGKYQDEFQRYLNGRACGPNHSPHGARLAFSKGLTGASLAIAGHHAGLHDLNELQTRLEERGLVEATRELIAVVERDCGPLPPIPNAPDWVRDEFSADVYVRMVFSCLVDADRLDSATWPDEPESDHVLHASGLLERVLAERARKGAENPGSSLLSARNRIFDGCLSRAVEPQGFFSLTVPTGGGKTLSSLAFALAHAAHHDLRRIILVIPYLSIIEQNAAVYRDILGADVVLENHSNVQPPLDVSEEERSRLELVSENWDAPVVVTTSVQFLESLFAASPSRCRKLHRIARSVVIFDEAQTLPAHLLAPCFSMFRELQRNYGVSFVFCSATLPAFRRTAFLPPDFFAAEEVRELAPDPAKLFGELRRVGYHLAPSNEVLDWPDLATQLAAEPQALCVVNVTRHAAILWEALTRLRPDSERPIHLSAAMCPAHRLDLIARIRNDLDNGHPCRVISTQLIEAGVDVDFPAVWRAMGPLDSIVQVAGRCNREGKLAAGAMHVFRPVEHSLPPGVYQIATELTATTLDSLGTVEQQAERLAGDPYLFVSYFQSLYQSTHTDYARDGEPTIQEDRRYLRFRTVAAKASVIEDTGRPVVVPYGDGPSLVNEIRSRDGDGPRFWRSDLRALQRFMVNVRNRDFEYLRGAGLVTELLPNLEIFVLSDGVYHKDLGILVRHRPLEDFLT
jgi:CRISPR-associated endonuclease/helicase Cas3